MRQFFFKQKKERNFNSFLQAKFYLMIFFVSLLLVFLVFILWGFNVMQKILVIERSGNVAFENTDFNNLQRSNELPLFAISDFGSLTKRGPFIVKKISDKVIESKEGPPDNQKIADVYLDIYYPQMDNRISWSYKFPVVIITHPTVASSMAPAREQYDYLAEHLVSNGYVVASYEWSEDMGQCEIFRNAQRETNIVNYLVIRNASSYSPLYQLMDVNNIALIGHSNGAFAQYFSKVEPKVKAFVGFAGLLCEWGGLYQDVAELTKPFMYIGGTKDQLRADTKRLQFFGFWDFHSGMKIMFDIINGDHWQFTDDFDYYPDVVRHYATTEPLFRNYITLCEKELKDKNPENDNKCQPKLIARDLHHEIVKYFVTAFFELNLKDNQLMKEALKNPPYREYMDNFNAENF